MQDMFYVCIAHCAAGQWAIVMSSPAIDYRQRWRLPGATGGTVKVAR